MKIIAGPLQGYTEAPFRHFHAEIFGGVDLYCAPFVRLEKGELRPKDMRELTSELNAGINLLPQVIFNGPEELDKLLDRVIAAGHTTVDLNLGCPFPPQVKKGRGAALIGRPEILVQVADLLAARPEIAFTAKMRLGVDNPRQWREALPALNRMPLRWLTVHPRVAVQQYGGDLHTDEFTALLGESAHPIVYSGGIATAGEAAEIAARWPGLHGLMLGRGLLARPSLAAEIAGSAPLSDSQLLEKILQLHEALLSHYSATLCGDAQLLMKIKPFWDYLEPLIGHKAAKAIRKAGSLARYQAATEQIM